MALQLILGSSGSGKSYQLYKKIIKESMEDLHSNYLILVPEQFSMETQKDLVRLHPHNGIINIDVLSFGRLAYRVFEELSVRQRPVLDDTGKNLVLRKMMGKYQKELSLYGSKLNIPGFIAEIKSMISELYQYGIGTQELEQMMELSETKPMLKAKLLDLAVIRRGFEEYMADTYVTKEELLDVLCRVVERSELIKKSAICLDGYTGFTPVQYRLLGLLIKCAKMVYVTVTLPASENPYRISGEQELFHLSKTTIAKLGALADEVHVTQCSPVRMEGEPYRFREAPALAALERNLFRYPYKVYAGKQEEIVLVEAVTPAKETEYVARRIWHLVKEKGLRYRDIAVISADMDQYGDILKEAFDKQGIPCFLDRKNSIMGNPFVEFVRAALMIVKESYSYESVFRYLRTGLTEMKEEDIDVLENYCLALGIRSRSGFERLWTRSTREVLPDRLEYINALRIQVFDDIEPLLSVWKEKQATVQEKLTALYNFIRAHDIQKKLSEREEQFMTAGMPGLAKEYGQTYALVMELFDKVVALLGEEKIDRRELSDILDSGFAEIKVGIIPPSLDQVLVGDMERTRLKDIKALFFLGLNDGLIPRNSSKGGILSQAEREFLKNQHITLSPTVRENAYIQKFYLYLNLTKPSHYLFLSYSRTSAEGKALRPSYLTGTLKKLFPSLKVGKAEENLLSGYLTTPEASMEFFLKGIRDTSDNKFSGEICSLEWGELYSWYLSHKEYKDRVRNYIKAAFPRDAESHIGEVAAARLYGPQPVQSVTRLEQYAACAFAHFLTYGLRLKRREEYELLSMDLGNMFHSAMEQYSKKLSDLGIEFTDVTEKQRRTLVAECIDEVTTDYGNSILSASARNHYLVNRLTRITDRTVWALQNQLKKGRFKPVSYEISFSRADHLKALTIPVQNGEEMRLQGRIDRLDLYEDESHVYVKIIDYKSGSAAFDFSSVYYGLQLQLFVYLDAAMELNGRKSPGKLVIPAGIFYYNIKDPVVDITELSENVQVEKELLDKLRMNGLVNSSEEVIRLMDQEFEKKSEVLPVSYNKDGTLSKQSSAVSAAQFAQAMTYVRESMGKMGSEMLAGNIAILPYEKGDRTACDFCDYRAVCGFDETQPGFHYRRLHDFGREEFLRRIMEGKEDGYVDHVDRGTEEGN